jgi:plastocyanin
MQIIDNAFVDPDGGRNDQARVDISVGGTVTWRHDGAIAHTVTSTSVPAGASTFDSGTMNPSDTFQVTFTVAGTYLYRCDEHPNEMVDAQVVVT